MHAQFMMGWLLTQAATRTKVMVGHNNLEYVPKKKMSTGKQVLMMGKVPQIHLK